MALRQMLLNSRSYKFCCSASREPPKQRRGLLTQVAMQVWVSKTSHHHQSQQTVILRNSISARTGSASYEAFLKTCCTTAVTMGLPCTSVITAGRKPSRRVWPCVQPWGTWACWGLKTHLPSLAGNFCMCIMHKLNTISTLHLLSAFMAEIRTHPAGA